MTSLERSFSNDFSDMLSLGLVEEITGYEVFNFFRSEGVLNVHAEYGYLVNEVTARLVRDWWCARNAREKAVGTAARYLFGFALKIDQSAEALAAVFDEGGRIAS